MFEFSYLYLCTDEEAKKKSSQYNKNLNTPSFFRGGGLFNKPFYYYRYKNLIDKTNKCLKYHLWTPIKKNTNKKDIDLYININRKKNINV